jgi:hypothetical protein
MDNMALPKSTTAFTAKWSCQTLSVPAVIMTKLEYHAGTFCTFAGKGTWIIWQQFMTDGSSPVRQLRKCQKG